MFELGEEVEVLNWWDFGHDTIILKIIKIDTYSKSKNDWRAWVHTEAHGLWSFGPEDVSKYGIVKPMDPTKRVLFFKDFENV